jgi:hypothetical protein
MMFRSIRIQILLLLIWALEKLKDSLTEASEIAVDTNSASDTEDSATVPESSTWDPPDTLTGAVGGERYYVVFVIKAPSPYEQGIYFADWYRLQLKLGCTISAKGVNTKAEAIADWSRRFSGQPCKFFKVGEDGDLGF